MWLVTTLPTDVQNTESHLVTQVTSEWSS